MDLKPTKKKIAYSLMISFFISLGFFVSNATAGKSAGSLRLSPEEFHLIYVIPIISFLLTYFFVCWLVSHKVKAAMAEPIKWTSKK